MIIMNHGVDVSSSFKKLALCTHILYLHVLYMYSVCCIFAVQDVGTDKQGLYIGGLKACVL